MSTIIGRENSPYRIHYGQADSDDVVVDGGRLVVRAGGTAVDPTVSAGGVAIVHNGGSVAITSGATSDIDGTLVNRGIVVLASSGTLAIGGTIRNTGELYASSAESLIDIAGVVEGGVALIGNGVVEIANSSGENVGFTVTGTGGLVLDGLGGAFSGRITGFGAAGHANSNQYIDFVGVDFAGARVSYKPANAADTSGTLTVTDGTHSASVALVGSYVTSDFRAINNGGSLEITDPTTIITSGYTVSAGRTLSANNANLILLSGVTASGALLATSGGDITVEGPTVIGSFIAEIAAFATGNINLDGTFVVEGNSTLEAETGGVITVQGAVTISGGAGAVAIQSGALEFEAAVNNSGLIVSNDDATLTMAQNVSNTGTIEANGDGNILMGGSNALTLTNRGLISATSESTIVMTYGSGIAGGVINQGEMVADTNAEMTFGASTPVINDGVIAANNGGIVLATNGGFTNSGTVVASGGQVNIESNDLINDGALVVLGSGSIFAIVASGGIAEINGSGSINNATGVITGTIDTIAFGAGTTNVDFNGRGVLQLFDDDPSTPTAFSGDITGFTEGDAIDLPGVPWSSGDYVTVTPDQPFGGAGITLNNSSGTAQAVFYFLGFDPNDGLTPTPYSGSNFIVNEDPSGGTIITDPILSDASAAEHLIGRDKHTPNIALLGNYIASFANGHGFAGTTPVIANPLTEQPLLARAHTG